MPTQVSQSSGKPQEFRGLPPSNIDEFTEYSDSRVIGTGVDEPYVSMNYFTRDGTDIATENCYRESTRDIFKKGWKNPIPLLFLWI